MTSLSVLAPWLVLALPVISLVRWRELRGGRGGDYAHYVEYKEFPIFRISLGKLVLFSLLGLGSAAYSVPFDRMVLALTALGICGYLVEYSFAYGRPMPTPGYRIGGRMCDSCQRSEHDKCTNLRMLDGFEKDFSGTDGYRSPVCCCGFRLGKWEKVPSGVLGD